MKANRKKGVLGLAAATLIGAGISAASNIIGSIANARQQKKVNEESVKAQQEANELAYQNNLQQLYNNRGYIDDKLNGIQLNTINNSQFRYGGPVIYRNRYVCGGLRMKRR